MSITDEYQSINCDDYDNLELACQHQMVLTIKLRGGEIVKGKATDLVTKKHAEFLLVTDADGKSLEIRLDHIASFSHPEIGTIVVNLS